METHMILVLTLTITFSYLSTWVSCYNVPALFVFGDSIFDAGNNHFNPNCTLQADFPPYGSSFFLRPTGRFTNGRTSADFIAQLIGIDLQKPYRQAHIAVNKGRWKDYPSNGLNFASAGSGVFCQTNQMKGVTPIQEQLQQFKALVRQNLVPINLVKQAIFLFGSGSNDIYNYFTPFVNPTPDPETYIQVMLQEVANGIDQIYKFGARRIVIFSLGPVGCAPARAVLPGSPKTRCYGKMNVMVKKYNKGLLKLALEIPIKHRRAVGVFGSVYDTFQHMRSNPKRYGLSNVTHACCGMGALGGEGQCGKKGYKMCLNPDKYLFWDFFHPSQHAYKIAAKALWTGKKYRIRPFNLNTLAEMDFNHIHH